MEGNVATFRVESVQKQERMAMNGDPIPVYIAWVRTTKGASGRITVPADVWEGDGLVEHLQAEADNLDKAFNLINGG